VINAALRNRERFAKMQSFFEGVGAADNAGVWEQAPAGLRVAGGAA
jgi:chlorophyllide a reductase subunit Y